MSLCRFMIMTFSVFLTQINGAYAKEIPVQARLFLGGTSVDPKEVNEVIVPQGIKKMETATQFGVEITYPLLKYLNVGVRYNKKVISNDEDPSDYGKEYLASVNQDALLLMAHMAFLKTDYVIVDAFAGYGGSNTIFKAKTASQDGELTRQAAEGWFATPYAAAGASLSLGFKQFFLVFEGGYETNKVNGFTRSGTVSSAIETVDLSGSYFTVGLLFDGVPGTIGK